MMLYRVSDDDDDTDGALQCVKRYWMIQMVMCSVSNDADDTDADGAIQCVRRR